MAYSLENLNQTFISRLIFANITTQIEGLTYVLRWMLIFFSSNLDNIEYKYLSLLSMSEILINILFCLDLLRKSSQWFFFIVLFFLGRVSHFGVTKGNTVLYFANRSFLLCSRSKY